MTFDAASVNAHPLDERPGASTADSSAAGAQALPAATRSPVAALRRLSSRVRLPVW